MIQHRHVLVGQDTARPVTFGNNLPLALIAGPCVLESREHALEMAHALREMTDSLGMPFVFKTSFDKANRTSINSARGIALEESMPIFAEIREKMRCPVLTDVHSPEQCDIVGSVVDILQIPAFLCRQTDLLIAAAKTGKALHIKKGQFLAPWDMRNVVAKVESAGNATILLCERGVSFGYNALVNDMRALPIMRATGCPVVFDATHSVQQPGAAGDKTSGERKFVPTLARAAVAVGIAGVFMETHQDPDNAPSDGPNMMRLQDMRGLLELLQQMDALAKTHLEDVA